MIRCVTHVFFEYELKLRNYNSEKIRASDRFLSISLWSTTEKPLGESSYFRHGIVIARSITEDALLMTSVIIKSKRLGSSYESIN